MFGTRNACSAVCACLTITSLTCWRCLQDLHLVKAQCSASTLVTKVKLVERCFENDSTVEFHMHDAAPADAAAPLPYFVKPEGDLVSDESALARYMADKGAPGLTQQDGVDADLLASALQTTLSLNKAAKVATKSKGEEVRAVAQIAVCQPGSLWCASARSLFACQRPASSKHSATIARNTSLTPPHLCTRCPACTFAHTMAWLSVESLLYMPSISLPSCYMRIPCNMHHAA